VGASQTHHNVSQQGEGAPQFIYCAVGVNVCMMHVFAEFLETMTTQDCLFGGHRVIHHLPIHKNDS